MKIDATAGETYLAFSPQTIGSVSEAADVLITNTGSAALIVSSVSVTTAAGDFAATNACTTTIAPGATCVLPVTFIPTVSSAINGQLTIASNAGNQVVALSGTGVGNMAGGGLALSGALSQKIHGSAGTFNVTIDIFKSITQAITTEPRSIGNGHVIVFQFSQPVTQSGTATAVDTQDANIGNVASVSAQGNNVFVTLTGIPDKSRVKVTLSNVNGIAGSYPVSLGFLIGDVTNNRVVNAGDIAATKARVGQMVGATTYRYDLNGNGAISGQDVSMVKSRAGVVLP
jgi:hypothetical protein